MEIIALLVSSGLMSLITTLVKRQFENRGIIFKSKQLYAFIAIVVGVGYILYQLYMWVDIANASALSASAIVIAQTVYDALKKTDPALLPNQWSNELWQELED